MRPTPRKSSTTVLTVLTAVTLAATATACGGSSDGDDGSSSTLTVYSGRGEDLVGPLIEQFEQESGIDVEVRYGDSAEMLLLIEEEGDNSPADVYYSQGAGFLGELSSAGRLSVLDDELLDRVPDPLRSPLGDWIGVSGRARTVVYNTDELGVDDLPDSILDFTDPQWQGRVGWAPTNASMQDFVTALRALVGDDDARAWLEGMIANGVVPYENNTAIVEAVAAGEISAGFVNHYYLYRFTSEDPDYPAANKFYSDGDPGALVNVAGAAILSGTDSGESATAFMEFLVSTDAQQYFAEQTFELPVVDGVAAPVDVPALESLVLPEFDLNALLDLRGTVAMLTDVGAL